MRRGLPVACGDTQIDVHCDSADDCMGDPCCAFTNTISCSSGSCGPYPTVCTTNEDCPLSDAGVCAPHQVYVAYATRR